MATERDARWFELSGDERIGRCATDGCGGQPTWRFEADGVGSEYCSGCAFNIRGLVSSAPDTPVEALEPKALEAAARGFVTAGGQSPDECVMGSGGTGIPSVCNIRLWQTVEGRIAAAIRAYLGALSTPHTSLQKVQTSPDWKLVPDEPTEGMLIGTGYPADQHKLYRKVYRAMLANAPKPPVSRAFNTEEIAAARDATAAESTIAEIIRAHDDNSGNEPSVSVFERAIDRARTALEGEAP